MVVPTPTFTLFSPLRGELLNYACNHAYREARYWNFGVVVTGVCTNIFTHQDRVRETRNGNFFPPGYPNSS